jgi:2',3'-cyclic-nucleotide 2'-phosphodiesterase/3'-nucleotidase/5'-nucleotidase
VTRPLVCITALRAAGAVAGAVVVAGWVAGCGVRAESVEVPRPTPHAVDTAAPPQLRPTHSLVLLGTTDVHNRLYPYDYYTRQEVGYGLARLKPVIDSVRAANVGRAYLFDSGDLLQGNPLGFVYARLHGDQPNPVIRAMNLLAYSASTIGNHEFNYGLAHLDRALQQAQFPFVTANVFKATSQEHAYQPFVLIPHEAAAGDTILIGVTGNTPPGVHIWDKANVEGILEFRDVVTSLRRVVAELKERGADVVVVLSHGGLAGTSYDTAATRLPAENASARVATEIPGIDVIFLGHTHGEIADTTINGVLLTQAKNWAQSLAVLTLKLERRRQNDWLVIDKQARIHKPDPARADTAFLDSLRWEHERTVAYVKSVPGRSAQRLEAREARVKDTPIMDFINEVQRKRTGADLSAASVFSTNAVIPQGPVTISDLAGLYIYDNTLKAIRLTGAQLKAFLEKSAEYYNGYPRTDGAVVNRAVPGYNFDVVSGVDYTIDISRPIGQRITKLLYQGRPVADHQAFTMALHNYRQAGGGGYAMIANAPVVYDRQEGIRELLIDEIRQRGTLRSADYFVQNWTLEPAAAHAPALEQQTARDVRPAGAGAIAKRLRVLATNDVHGRLLPETYSWSNGRAVGGAAALTSYFRLEADGFEGVTVVLDGGDVMQGTPISNLTRGRSTVDFFNAAGYRGAAIGNHEFDWGVPMLRERIAQAKFAWLSANIFNAGTATQPAWSKPTALLEVGNVKVGIIGLSTEETPATTKSTHVAGLEFRSGSAAIDRWVPELRSAGADFVIVIAHAGAFCDREFTKCEGEMVDWARQVKHKPDLLVAGHTHRLVRWIENGIPIVEAASYTTRYGVVDLQKDSTGVHVWIRDFPVPFADRVQPDSAVARMVAAARRKIGPQVNRVIATLADTIRRGSGEGALGNLLADAFRVTTGADISLVNNGSIRISELPAGPVTWGTLYSLQPFENRMVKLWLTGAQIRELIEHALAGTTADLHVSGLIVRYDSTAPARQRVERMTLSNGKQISDAATYVVGVTDFLALGTGDGYQAFGRASKREDIDLLDLDAVIKYLQSQPQPIKADHSERRFQKTVTEHRDGTS